MSTWQSESIHIHADLHVDAKGSPEGVTAGIYVNNDLATDVSMTSDQARAWACALIEAADKSDESARTP